MDVPLIDLTLQHEAIKAELQQAVTDVLESQRFIMGPEVEALEAEIAEYVGVSHAIGVASGTDALLLSLKALDAPPGSSVIVPAFTFFATAGAVWNAGLRPVFCDVDPVTFNVTRATLEAAWTPDTVAVVPVHLFGQMADMAAVRDLAAAIDAFVLEDAAQSIGARSPLGSAGAVGDAGAFSFYPTKNLGGFGDGGMVTTNDEAFADRVRKLRAHGEVMTYHHEIVGTNSRLDALQAALLRVKLRHLDEWTAARRRNAARFEELLSDVSGIQLPGVADGNSHVYNQFTVVTERRDELREYLRTESIGSGIYYPLPLHLQDCFAKLGYRRGSLPVAEGLCRQVLSLPIYPELGEDRLGRVAGVLRSFVE